VSGGKIADITITSHQEDAEYFNKAKSSIINQIISSQSLEVQAVSGATRSSNGIINAVANALGVSSPVSSSGGKPGRN
jgi:uncharacterized protein with FMN-binding domain